MSKKRYRPKEIVCMLRDAADLTSQDKPVTHVIKPLKVSEVTCYNWLRIKVAWVFSNGGAIKLLKVSGG